MGARVAPAALEGPPATDGAASLRADCHRPSSWCARCNGAAADAGDDADAQRCVFCYAATGEQYVPFHYERGRLGECSYSPSLSGHCACKACWASWHKEMQTTSHLHCPVCHREIDICRGYHNGQWCGRCWKKVVLERLPTTAPPAKRERACCCCCSPLFCKACIVLAIMVISAMLMEAFALVMMDHVRLSLTDDHAPGNEPPLELQQTLCPAFVNFEALMQAHPLARMGSMVARRFCSAYFEDAGLSSRTRRGTAARHGPNALLPLEWAFTLEAALEALLG